MSRDMVGRQVLFWGAALVLFILLILMLQDVLLPFVLGMVLAYFLNPLAVWLEKMGLSRTWATVVLALMFSTIATLFLLILGPILFHQIADLAVKIPSYMQQLQTILVTGANDWVGKYLPGTNLGAEEAMHNLTKQAAGQLTNVINSLWTSGKALFGFVSALLITPVVTFFLLKDWNRLVGNIDGWLPRDHAPVIRLLARRINRSIHGFIHGQVTISIFIGVFYAIALTIVGLKYGLLIGITAGLLNIIPFLGSLVGFLISIAMAIVQYSPEWQPILYVAAIFAFGQLIDTNVLTPKIIGDKVRLHPVWLIFALIVSGYVAGLFGMLLAIPIAAAIGVLVRYFLERYLASALYTGTSGNSGKAVKTADAVEETGKN